MGNFRHRDSTHTHACPDDRRDKITTGLAIVSTVDSTAERIGHERAIDDQLFG